MIAIGGTLLLTPGFITDIFGLILLIPPSRADHPAPDARPTSAAASSSSASAIRRCAPAASRRKYDYDGTAEEVDADDPRLDR